MALRISARNARFQQIEALRMGRNRRLRERSFLVQGVRPISQAMEHDWRIETAIFDAGRRLSSWAQSVLTAAGESIAMSAELLAELAEKEEGETEVVVIARMPEDDLSRIPTPSDLLGLVFDRPTQPGNVGAVLRSLDAFGGHGLIVSGHAADVYDPKAVRASTGSLFAVPSVRAASQGPVMDWVSGLRESGTPVTLVATDEDGERELWDHDFNGPTLLLLGNETSGLSRGWREAADVTLRIPMGGSASSLNAATAAALVLYEASRHRAQRAR